MRNEVRVWANGHCFVFPPESGNLGRCCKCKTIVTEKEARHKQFDRCDVPLEPYYPRHAQL